MSDGTLLRFYARPGCVVGGVGPILGFAILGDGIEPGDCVEVRLGPAGTATWHIRERGIRQAVAGDGYTADAEFADGIVRRACVGRYPAAPGLGAAIDYIRRAQDAAGIEPDDRGRVVAEPKEGG